MREKREGLRVLDGEARRAARRTAGRYNGMVARAAIIRLRADRERRSAEELVREVCHAG